MTKPLSPAAQAVLDAAEDAYLINYSEFYNCADSVAAAALRALADQVVPKEDDPPPLPPVYDMIENPIDSLVYETSLMQRQETRAEILAIAAELDNIQ